MYVEYLEDVEEATVCYCAVQAYNEAIQVARKQDREDLVETDGRKGRKIATSGGSIVDIA